jgi:MscS family membrane protein
MMGRVSPIPILVTVWMVFGGMNLMRDIYSSRLQRRDRSGAAVLLRPATNAVKLLIGLGAALVYLDNLGVNITTVLAGLGVGGIAVALALQKPMEDVFGAITLYTQQPVRVGDFCRVGTEMGTIEEIGLRTTRLRTLANTLIAIPNARLANEPIDNISARKKILYRPVLRLRYDTTPEQLQHILDGIREVFGSHDRVLQDNHRVRFKEIADDALLIEVYAYLDTKDADPGNRSAVRHVLVLTGQDTTHRTE